MLRSGLLVSLLKISFHPSAYPLGLRLISAQTLGTLAANDTHGAAVIHYITTLSSPLFSSTNTYQRVLLEASSNPEAMLQKIDAEFYEPRYSKDMLFV